ncbi:MAG: DUF2017 family protein [Chloroflexota bacterium]
MPDQRPAPVERVAAGRYALRLDDGERRVIGSLLGQLDAVVAQDPSSRDPALGRLYPPMIPEDPAADAEITGLIRADLADGRARQRAAVLATIEATTLDEAQAAAWLGVCNDLRLVLGTRLGITGEDDPEPDADDPDGWPLMVFHWLGWLVGCIVDALAGGLPASGAGEGAEEGG